MGFCALPISQVYDVLKHSADMSNEELAATFQDWNQGELQVEIKASRRVSHFALP